MDKGLKRLQKLAVAQGWEIRPTKKGFFFVPPDMDRSMVLAHTTPSDHHAWKNLISELRKSGLDIPRGMI